MNPSAPIGSLLTIGCCWGHERGVNRFFANNCERPVVWAALCERTFEVVESNGHKTGALEVQQKSYTLWAALCERTFEVVKCVQRTRAQGRQNVQPSRTMRGRSPHICNHSTLF